MQLCTYSRSEHLAGAILDSCPLGFVASERDHCGCRQREIVSHGRLELRVLACRYPRKWNGQEIRNPEAYTRAIRLARQKQGEATNYQERLAHVRQQKEGSESMTTAPTTPPRQQPQQQPQQAPTATTNQPAPLWPQPIPVLGLTGEKWSGKTLCGLTIDPKRTLIYDTEKSSQSYEKLGFTRIDVMAEMLKKYPKGHKPIERFLWWLDHVRSIQPGRFSVIMADTVNEIENGLADWVEAHPEHFGHTRQQYQKMSGIKWGDVKDYWLSIIASDLASRCETFVFVTHMGDVWGDNKPTGKRKPKGKDTLYQLASLYLKMERRKDAKGNLPAVPSADVLKDRIADFRISESGEITVVPLLPPRLPVATPAAIRKYMLAPPDWSKLKPEERQAAEETMSEDDRAAMRLAVAEAERDAEQLRLERLQRQQEAAQRSAAGKQQAVQQPSQQPLQQPTQQAPPPSPPPSTPPPSAPTPNGQPAEHKQRASFSAHAVTEEQLTQLAAIRDELWAATMPNATAEEKKAKWLGILAKRNVNTARALTHDQAAELISKIRSQLDIIEMERGRQQPEGGDGAGADPAPGG